MTYVCPDMGFFDSIIFRLQQFCDCWHEFLYLCYCSWNSITVGFENSRLLNVTSFPHVFNIEAFWDTH